MKKKPSVSSNNNHQVIYFSFLNFYQTRSATRLQDQTATRTTRNKAKEIVPKQSPRQTTKKILKKAKSTDLQGVVTRKLSSKQTKEVSLAAKKNSEVFSKQKTLIVEDVDMEVESSSEEDKNHYSDEKEECKMIITVDKSKLIPEDIADN